MLERGDPKFLEMVEGGVPIKTLMKRLRPGQDSTIGFLGEREKLTDIVYEDFKVVESYGTTHQEIAEKLFRVFAFRHSDHEMGMLRRRMFILPGFLDQNYAYLPAYIGTAGDQHCPWYCEKEQGQNAGTLIKRGLGYDEMEEAKYSQFGKSFEAIYDGFKRMGSGFSEDENLEPKAVFERILESRKKERATFYAPLTTLLPHLIEKHYFFEGKKTIFRAEPEFLIKALDLDKGEVKS